MLVVFDIETLKSCITYTDIDVKTREVHKFVIHESRNDLSAMMSHFLHLKGMIGYNNLAFDYPVLHYIAQKYTEWLEKKLTTSHIIALIYSEAQRIIDANNTFTTKYSTIKPKDVLVPQLDLFKMWHYDNKAKLTSLKALEISMNYPNVLDMPISHDNDKITKEEVEDILNYNLNDVLATLAFYEKSGEKINLRRAIYKKYGLPCMSWNNGKIGEQLILKLYCDKTETNPWDVKKLKSKRDKIELKDCIPPNVKFQFVGFENLLNYLKSKVITETKGAFDYVVPYKGVKYVYGTGGIHASIKEGVYESTDEYVIKSFDVSSLYPSLAIQYKFYPEHLGPEFLDVYENEIVKVRLAEKAKGKDGDKTIIDGFKECANICYGKSNEEFSFLYDPLYTMKTTIAGQLLLTMLIEGVTSILNSQVLLCNTDGAEIRIPRKYEHVYEEICKTWEKETGLILEHTNYAKMIIADVNNYIAINENGKVKSKGRFEVNKVLGSDPAYYKDNSFRVIPLAIQEYFVKGTPIAQTIMLHHNIYDFCGRQKFKKGDQGVTKNVSKNMLVSNYEQKNVRYYVSKTGGSFHKYYKGGKEEIIHRGYLVTVFNNYIEKHWDKYNIDYSFYIKECRKEIDNIEKKQLMMLINNE